MLKVLWTKEEDELTLLPSSKGKWWWEEGGRHIILVLNLTVDSNQINKAIPTAVGILHV